MKTTVIHHSADFDGEFCREIARKFLPEAELIGWDYGDAKLAFPKEGLVYVLDLNPECFSELPDINEVGRRLVWIDHHKSAIEQWPSVFDGYRIDGVAACRLAWQWFATAERNLGDAGQVLGLEYASAVLPTKEQYYAREVKEPWAVRLAGEYDVWDKRDAHAETFQFGLRSETLSAALWNRLLGEYGKAAADSYVELLLDRGFLLQKYQRDIDASVVKGRSFTLEFEGLKFLALNTARCNSLTFAAGVQPAHDALMGFFWNGQAWKVSMYHAPGREGHDLSKVAARYGGGGHRGACGFQVSELPFGFTPEKRHSTAALQNLAEVR
jgi:oligoribonuclease NrnB/cAMP/cGMP phosphodiesterase (DHH superfamily)